jgi:hypothetical protein
MAEEFSSLLTHGRSGITILPEAHPAGVMGVGGIIFATILPFRSTVIIRHFVQPNYGLLGSVNKLVGQISFKDQVLYHLH